LLIATALLAVLLALQLERLEAWLEGLQEPPETPSFHVAVHRNGSVSFDGARGDVEWLGKALGKEITRLPAAGKSRVVVAVVTVDDGIPARSHLTEVIDTIVQSGYFTDIELRMSSGTVCCPIVPPSPTLIAAEGGQIHTQRKTTHAP
jgi:hypothetical protein